MARPTSRRVQRSSSVRLLSVITIPERIFWRPRRPASRIRQATRLRAHTRALRSQDSRHPRAAIGSPRQRVNRHDQFAQRLLLCARTDWSERSQP